MTREQYDSIASWASGSTGEGPRAMLYRSYTDGMDGAKFELLRDASHTDEDVREAKTYLRLNHDVVSIRIIQESELFKSNF